MKILVVQLLRLGDVVLSTPVLKGLRAKYPSAQIDILIHRQFAGLVPLMPWVSHAHYFDYHLIQSALGEYERGIFEAHDRVAVLLNELAAENYDQVVNLTQNQFSGYIVGALDVDTKTGLWVDDALKSQITSPWFEYLNADTEFGDERVFHFVDVFRGAARLSGRSASIGLEETSSGKEQAEAFLAKLPPSKHRIALQCLTSDTKKDWGLSRFVELAEMLIGAVPDTQIVVPAAKNEVERLQKAFEGKKHVSIFDCGLETAFSLIGRVDLLVTGDTSIKHMAAAAGTQVIEISIGSSDFKRTGVYLDDALIVQSGESCAPCEHSSPCHRARQFCAERISAELIAALTIDVVRNGSLQIKQIAEGFKDQATVYRVDVTTADMWTAIPVNAELTEVETAKTIEKFIAKFCIESKFADQDIFAAFGSEGLKVAQFLRKYFPEASAQDQRFVLASLERQSYSFEARLRSFEHGFSLEPRSQTSAAGLQNSLIGLREFAKKGSALGSYKDNFDSLIESEMPHFLRIRKIQNIFKEMKNRTEVELKLLRFLQTQMEA